MGGGDAVTRAWETAGYGVVGTSSAEPDAGTSGARGAMGADSLRRCSSWPREGDRVGEVQALTSPFSAEGGAAAVPSFLLFAVDSGLDNQRRRSGSSDMRKNKTEIEHLLIHHGVFHPPLEKLEA